MTTDTLPRRSVCPDCGSEYVNTSKHYALCPNLHGKLVASFSCRERDELRETRWLKTYPTAVYESGAWRIEGRKEAFRGVSSTATNKVTESYRAVPPEVVAVVVRESCMLLWRFRPTETP